MIESTYILTYIQEHPQETKRLLGIDYQQLQDLIAYGKLLHEKKKQEIEQQKTRVIKAGGGNKPKLSEEEQIILMLLYLRHYPSFQLLGIMFQISESSAHNIFNYWQSLLGDNLPASLLEQLKKYQEEMEKVKEELIEYELLVDSTEQPIERPSEQDIQKPYYSGKQKRHTLKSQVISLPESLEIIDVLIGEKGSRSDISMLRQRLNKFDKNQGFLGDKAYAGESQVVIPKKKPKKGELSQEEKDENNWISSKRVIIEHVIRLLKIFKIMQERFRLRRGRYESVIKLICGLVRLRIGTLILNGVKSRESGQIIEVLMTHSFPLKMDLGA
ncbi:MAG: hypothetical protein RLZZ203_53 [Cyanobacteriota bacterium]|jgi:hypothetical protein